MSSDQKRFDFRVSGNGDVVDAGVVRLSELRAAKATNQKHQVASEVITLYWSAVNCIRVRSPAPPGGVLDCR